MQYFPDTLPKGTVPDKEYFFNILNTIRPEYLKRVLTHANNKRNLVQEEENQANAMEISDEWWERLNQEAFTSSKYS